MARASPLANELYLQCVDEQEICYSYLLGVFDGALYDPLTPEDARPFCTGGTVNGAQLRLVFLKFARAHPEYLSYSRGRVVVGSFVDAFPCKRRQS